MSGNAVSCLREVKGGWATLLLRPAEAHRLVGRPLPPVPDPFVLGVGQTGVRGLCFYSLTSSRPSAVSCHINLYKSWCTLYFLNSPLLCY